MPTSLVKFPHSGNSASAVHIIDLVRRWQTRESTVAELRIADADTARNELGFGYVLERPGPDSSTPNLRLRIPEGSYNLKWRHQTGLATVRPHLPVPWLYGETLSDERMIYIHNGNFPKNTDGCLLVGATRQVDFVGNSVDALRRLKAYLKRVGIDNAKLVIRSNYVGSKPMGGDVAVA